MQQQGYDVHLDPEKQSNNSTKVCPDLNQHSLSAQTLRLVDEVYKEDFGKLGYKTFSKPFVFMDIPENGGDGIATAAQKRHYTYSRFMEDLNDRISMPDNSWCEKYKVPPQFLATVDRRHFLTGEVFCVTRHPYDRAIAEYFHMLSIPGGQKMSDFYDVGLTAGGDACTKEGLNFFLQRVMTLMSEGQPFALDCRMVPQAQYVWDKEGYQWCERTLKFEELPGAYNSLMKDQDYQDFEMANDEGPHAKQFCPNLDRKDLEPTTLKLLNDVYKEDFRRLGFSAVNASGDVRELLS